MNIFATCSRQPWNKGKLVGQKAPLRLRDLGHLGKALDCRTNP